MKRALAPILLLVLLLAACMPTIGDQAPDSVLTALPVEGGATYRAEFTQPVDRLVLLFTGPGLTVNAPECTATPDDVACIVHDISNFYEVTIGGTVERAEGIVQRGREYGLLTIGGTAR